MNNKNNKIYNQVSQKLCKIGDDSSQHRIKLRDRVLGIHEEYYERPLIFFGYEFYL